MICRFAPQVPEIRYRRKEKKKKYTRYLGESNYSTVGDVGIMERQWKRKGRICTLGMRERSQRKTYNGNGKGINVAIITSFCGTSWTIIMRLRMDVTGVVSYSLSSFFMVEWTILFLFGWVFLLRKNTTWIDALAEERFIVCEKMMS